jgi:hypothetical protein
MRERRITSGVVVLAALACGLWWWLGGDGGDGDARARASRPGVTADVARARVNRAAPADTTPGSLAGHVVRARDRAGVAGAVVAVSRRPLGDARWSPPDEEPRLAVTDVTGAWSLPAVPPGRYLVSAAAAELLPGRVDVDLAAREARTGIDLALGAGGVTLSGTLTDLGGGPIAGGAVTARSTGPRSPVAANGYVALSDAHGHYRLTLLDDAWLVTASHADYAPKTTAIELRGQPRTLDFALTPGGQLRGQVIARDTGQPVPGARVSTGEVRGDRGRDAEASRAVVADADGRFAMRGLSAGAVSLTASARGYASANPTVVELGVGDASVEVELWVDRGYTISGAVIRDAGVAVGVPGVHVGVFSMAEDTSASAVAPSAADGAFEIVGVRPGRYVLVGTGLDLVLEIGQPVTVVDRDVTDVVVRVTAGATLAGTVTPGAVTAVGLELDVGTLGAGDELAVMQAEQVHGESDASGGFTLRNVPPGAFTLVAQAADGRVGKLPVVVTAADQAGLVIGLEPRGAVSGRVLDRDGRPVAGVTVHAGGQDDGIRASRGLPDAVTAADGRYRVAGLPPGEVALIVSDDDGPRPLLDGAIAAIRTLTGSEELRDVVLRVEAADGAITGVVHGLDRAPQADVWVTARPTRSPWQTAAVGDSELDDPLARGHTVMTGDDGQFAIRGLRRGSYRVTAEAATGGRRAQRAGVETGATVTLVLEALGALSGVVTSGGRPVTSYELRCDGPGGAPRRQVAAADGSYTLERVPPGHYRCAATADAGTATGETTLEGTTGRLDLSLVSWASITGTVVDAAGQPQVGLLVVVASSEGGLGDAFGDLATGDGHRTDATGRFTVDRLASGRSHLRIMSADTRSLLASQEITLVSGQRLDLRTIKLKTELPRL